MVIMDYEETKEERKKRLAREATQRWREKNRERHRDYQRMYAKRIEWPMCPLCGKKMGKMTAKRCINCFVGENHSAWKGGRWTNTYGYVQVKVPEGTPGRTKNGYILEHRKVMQDFLGRALLPFETVHHINGIRDDNRIENLELWVSHQPAGQRVDELIKWAKEILSIYEGFEK